MMRPTTAFAASLLLAASAAGAADAPKPQASVVVEEEAAPATPPPPSQEERLLIGEEVRRNTDQVQACYAKALERKPVLFGMLVAEFDIGPNGKVIGATADGIADRDLLLCVVQAVRKWQFAKPLSGGKLRVRYPWKLEPRASKTPQTAGAAGSTEPRAAR